MKYQKKPVIVDAIQWNKDKDLQGNHPAVCPYGNQFNTTMKALCKDCGLPMLIHGFMVGSDSICPGDWIVTYAEGNSRQFSQAEFEREFESAKTCPNQFCHECDRPKEDDWRLNDFCREAN